MVGLVLYQLIVIQSKNRLRSVADSSNQLSSNSEIGLLEEDTTHESNKISNRESINSLSDLENAVLESVYT